MLVDSLLAAALVAAAPEIPTPPAPAADPAKENAIGVVVVDAVTVDAELVDELAVRLPGREVIGTDALTDVPTSRFAWVGVEWVADDRARLRLVLSDGRAYSRLVDADAAQLRRAVAGVLANMLDAIEHNRIEPEQTGVAVPLSKPKPVDPAPTPPPPAKVEPAVAAQPPVAKAKPTWELGPFIGGAAVVGVGPPKDLAGFVGAGAALGLDAVHASGGLATISARVITHARDELRIVRVRVALAGGYALRLRSFELLTRAGISVEPVILRDRGSTPQLRRPSGDRVGQVPLVGVLAGVSPAYVVRAKRRALALRLSLDLELAASMEARSPPGAIRYVDTVPDVPVSLLRAGGVELSFGLGVGGWFGLP